MKAILEFDLPQDQEALELAENGPMYKFLIDDVDNWLRGLAKYEDKEVVSIEEVRERLRIRD